MAKPLKNKQAFHSGLQAQRKQKKMRNPVSLSEEDDNEMPLFYWWRSAEEFNENGELKLNLSKLSNLTPRLKVLREMERLALIAPEGLDELRQKLFNYRSGDFYLPIGGISKEEMDIPPVIMILLVGFSGSGKSSLINLMYSVLGRSGLIPFAHTSGNSRNYTTTVMEEHNVLRSMRSGFCVYDSRSLDYNRMSDSLETMSRWLGDGVYHHQPCWITGDEALGTQDELKPLMESMSSSSSSRFRTRTVNCVIVVINIAEVYQALMNGDSKPLEATKELFSCPAIRKCNENPVLIMTHGDMMSTEERMEGRIKICEYLGVSETNGVYDIVCLSEHGILANGSDPVTAYALTEAVYRALMVSDRNHLPKRNIKDWVLLVVTWLMYALSCFFAVLAFLFSKLSRGFRFLGKMAERMDLSEKMNGSESEETNIKCSDAFSSVEGQVNDPKKSCTDCGTSKTPLWRGGPAGPKSLCNACGIRYRKKRRALLGLNKGRQEKEKKERRNNPNNKKLGVSIKLRLLELGREVFLDRSTTEKHRKLGEEEQAAVLLMALSCGSVYA
ncbi:hypothetical protein NE237_011657 [Protea cynaroides]|uniref:GATA-type domain-containing protein n=1 Tax=Protea cynaroides TaxID=273540 RepID=A0A9Q0JW13_9MAGN|nr:hypothetical protein NE237_011657 [Protea cynaroides]